MNQTLGGPLVRALRARAAYCSLLTNEFSTEGLRAYGHSFGGNGALNTPKVTFFTAVSEPFYNVQLL
jgi:hypothetical protein